jgi:hypothetical protein
VIQIEKFAPNQAASAGEFLDLNHSRSSPLHIYVIGFPATLPTCFRIGETDFLRCRVERYRQSA